MQQFTKCKFGFCGKDIIVPHPKNPKSYRHVCNECVEKYTPLFGQLKDHYASRIWRKIKAMHGHAVARGKYPVEITFEDIFEIWPEDNICPIFGFQMCVAKGIKADRKHSPSIDRIDSSKGYIKGNIQIVSVIANRLMSDATGDELLKFAEWINKTYSKE